MPRYLAVSRSITGLDIDLVEDFETLGQLPVQVYVQAYEIEYEDMLDIMTRFEKESTSVIVDYLKETKKMVYNSLDIEKKIEPLDPENIRKRILQKQILAKFSKDFNMNFTSFLADIGVKDEDVVDILLGMENIINSNIAKENVTLEEIQHEMTRVILNKLVQYGLKDGTIDYGFEIEDVMNILNLKEETVK